MSRNREIKARYFSGAKAKDMHYYAISLLEKKPENILLHLDTNDAPCKSCADILKDLIELKDFIQEKSPSCKRITLALYLEFVLIEKRNKQTEKTRYIF